MKKTIAAIATPRGTGGIAVIRLSGEDARKIASKIYRGKENLLTVPTHRIVYGHAVRDEKTLDECLYFIMDAPHSFTGENTVEISCHGGFLVTQKILEALIEAGASLAEPGEFTKRAFLNGKMDLSRAEAVADIISANGEGALSVAVSQLEGSLSQKIGEIREKILFLCASADAAADFPEEDIEEIADGTFLSTLEEVNGEIDALLQTAHRGELLREGVLGVIVGLPNAGKSSLLNCLLGESRAIVTEVPGTTRDVIKEYIDVGGITVCLADTAGIHETENLIEEIGVRKSREYLKKADFCIYVVGEYEEELPLPAFLPTIRVNNKADILGERPGGINLSAKTGEGVEDLWASMNRLLRTEEISENQTVITSLRHKEALLRGKEAVEGAIGVMESGMEKDLTFIFLENALSAMGEITGESVSDEIVDQIFHRFCLGK